MVIVINFVIGGFSWVDLIGRFSCPITGAWLQATDDYNCIEWLVKYKAADAPITFEEIVMVMINIKKLIREPSGESVIRTKHRNGA